MIVALISPEETIRQSVQSALAADDTFDKLWSVPEYPDSEALSSLIDQVGGCIVVVDFGQPLAGREVAAALAGHDHLRLVAVNARVEGGGLSAAAKSGIRDIFGESFSTSELTVAMRRAAQEIRSEKASTGAMIDAFLPARPGAGATTVALHTAAALSAMTRTLFLDFDLKLGISSFLLKLHSDFSVKDALDHARRLEDGLWGQMVSRREDLELLGSAPDTFQQIVPDSSVELLVRYARRRYANVCIDLPGNMDSQELIALRKASRILLVSVPDVTGLHMARRKLRQLDELGLGDKVWLVLNQCGGRHLFTESEAANVLGLAARVALPEDRSTVAAAVQGASFVRANTLFGRKLAGFARELVGGEPAPVAVSPVRRFVEFFSVTETRKRAG